MSKRRISKQQESRISQKHKDIITSSLEDASLENGLVICRYGKHAQVENVKSPHEQIHCSIRANLDSVVAGDRVAWQKEGDQQGVILSRFPRRSVLGRSDKQGRLKPIAANITQIFIVIAPLPLVSWTLLDSYLIIAEFLNITPTIVLNKLDLAHNDIKENLSQCYQKLGYRILFTSLHDERSTKTISTALKDNVSVFVGQSGVGKSSLISSVLPHEIIETAPNEIFSEHGRHTTSSSRYYHLPAGGALIDSPGVREMSLWHMPPADIARGFKEFHPFLSFCKFRNCTHQLTPGCALKQALDDNNISQQRYESYVKISTQFSK
jgi:ribosome biogenesis GTPase